MSRSSLMPASSIPIAWWVEYHYSRPISRRIVRDGEHGRGIPDIHPDDGFFGQRLAGGLKQTKCEVAAPRSFDDQIRSQSLAFSFAVLETDRGNGGAAGRDDNVLSAAILADRVSLNPLSRGEFD
jgi:hypothetical protein